MKFLVNVDGEQATLDLRQNASNCEYILQGATTSSGTASVLEVSPGVFSVLLDTHSFTVSVSINEKHCEVLAGSSRHSLTLADIRDRGSRRTDQTQWGPLAVRSQMPGKVIKILVGLHSEVRSGQPLIVVEAMKMQNEMKSPKAGRVSKIEVEEGAPVAAGQTLIVVE
jgi:biotin carboxyl carrier protein